MNNKTLLVAQREFVENLRTKAFWIGILLFPVIITVMMVVPALLERNKSTRTYAVVDRSDWLLEAVEERAAMPDLEKVFKTAMETVRSGEGVEELPESLRETAEQLIRGVDLVSDQQTEVPPDELEEKVVTGFASTIAGFAGTEGAAIREMLPPEATKPLEDLRESIREWWLALPAEEAEQFGSGLVKSRYQRVDVEGTSEAVVDELSRRVDEGELFAVFVVGEDPVASNEGFRYLSANLTDDDLRNWFSRLASSVVRERRLQEKEIDSATAAWIQEPTRFDVARIAEGGETKEVEAQDLVRQWAPVAFVYLLWISVFTIAQMLLTNTVEEKSNRLMEVLLSSVSPLQLMIGKILGIAATGMTMLISWMIFFYLATKFLPRLFDVNIGFDLSVIAADPVYIGSFLLYFLLGYLLYASLLVGIGSVCNSLKEAQNLMSPIMIVLFVPLVTMMPVGKDPNGLLAQVLSYIPLFTPFVMMNRAAGPPTTFEYVVTTILLVAAVAAAMWAAAKVFRVGVLMTGKPPKPLEILRWIKAPVGVVPNRGEAE
ncbi:MAG: ABC transporter permease [Acidobacteriota bacterium]